MGKDVSHLKVALVHDYLREYGGAERVVEALHDLFPEAPLYTAFVDKDALGIHWKKFSSWNINESAAAKIPGIKKLYSPLRLFASYFFEGFNLSEYDVVISSTNMYMAKAALTRPETLHLSYIHTPPRSLYGYTTASNWKKNPITRFLGELINFRMRQIDYLTSQRPDVLVANSKEVSDRILKFYKRESVVVYPPVSVAKNELIQSSDREYYLYVNRLVFAKHPEIAVEAMTNLSLPLRVVGAGPMEEKLNEMAGKNVTFLGAVNDEELSKLYAGAKAILYPVEDEDFGMVPIEAMLSGTPVIAHTSGGPKETIHDGQTGVLFNDLSVKGVMEAIGRFQKLSFDPKMIQSHAKKFSKEEFEKKMLALVEKEYTKTVPVKKV